MTLPSGTSLGSYEIVTLLGAGGMGEVYRARDPRLGRDVALKVLSADFAHDPGRLERFSREARAVAALNHPHIVTIYSTEEAGGVRFLTMELVEGQTLDAVIPPDGLSLARFLEIALPLSDALNAAHQKQIVHRDLKPGNVMITADGRVKVLDFGLARVVAAQSDSGTAAATQALLTHEGTIVGTMPYMPPEQVAGQAVDHRSDLFSLGVMFFEMLTGVRPFNGDSAPLLMSAILRDTPEPVTVRRADVPETLARLVSRCLEKRTADRLQSAREVRDALWQVQKQLESGAARPDSQDRESSRRPPSSGSAARSAMKETSVAVLPFLSRTADEEVEALADGLTEDITGLLSRFSYLQVVSHASAERLKGKGADARAASIDLGARYLVEGSVRRAGTTVRVSARLVDADTGGHLWAETYDREGVAGAFEVQDEIASRIVATVANPSGVLVRSMAMALRGRPIEALTAGELGVRYHAYVEQFRPEEHARLRDSLERAVEREPGHAEAWACLALMYEHEHSQRLNPRPDPLGRQRRAAARAVCISPTFGSVPVTQPLTSSNSTIGCGLFTSRNTAEWTVTPMATMRGSSAVPWRGWPSSGNHIFQSGAYRARMIGRSRDSFASPETEIHSRVRSL